MGSLRGARKDSINQGPLSDNANTPSSPNIHVSHFSAPDTVREGADPELDDDVDYASLDSRADKASRVLGIRHRKSMEPIPASTRTSLVSTRSVRDQPSIPSFQATSPLTSLYVVSGLPKSPHTWTLADPDSVLGLHHSEGAVNRWWRPEVLGSTVSPGAGGSTGKKKKRVKNEELLKGAGVLSKQEVAKMLSKALKVWSPPRPYTRFAHNTAAFIHPRGRGYCVDAAASFHGPHVHIHTSRTVYPSGTHTLRRPTARLSSLVRRQPVLHAYACVPIL